MSQVPGFSHPLKSESKIKLSWGKMNDNKTRTTRWCVLNDESHAPPGWPILQLVQDPLRAYEAPFCTAVFSDNPGKTSLNGRSALVQVVAIQTHSCFQSKGIPRAQAGE
jgi:hypothetical protein